MTPKERAERFWASTANPDLRYEDLIPMVEKAFEEERKIAVEEDRKSRECCKQEREACALICDDMAQMAHDVKKGSMSAKAYSVAGQAIRARSES